MVTRIIFYSGGLGSFAAADFVKNKYPDDNIVLYFTDTLFENADLYRFLKETSDKLELPLLYQAVGVNPLQLMVNERFVFNNRVGRCSQVLKMEIASDYLRHGSLPKVHEWYNKQHLKNDELKDPVLYFGIGFDEMHRKEAIEYNWQPFEVAFPLIDNIIDYDEVLKKYDIETPELYTMGFTHNNCDGRCIKAGQGHFLQLRKRKPEQFEQMHDAEIVISEYVRYTKQLHGGKDHMYNDVYEYVTTGKETPKIKHILATHKYTKGWNYGYNRDGLPVSKPYTFMKNKSLADIADKPEQVDLFDIGGCACFA